MSCPICSGTGKVSRPSFQDARASVQRSCHACKGSGELPPDIDQLRADLATVTAERDHALSDVATLGDLGANRQKLLLAERAAHAETRKALEALNADYGTLLRESNAHEIALESTRAELAKAEARVKAATSSLVKSIGQCSHCGERAPLMEGAKLPSHKLKLICVYGWGCSAGEALRG